MGNYASVCVLPQMPVKLVAADVTGSRLDDSQAVVEKDKGQGETWTPLKVVADSSRKRGRAQEGSVHELLLSQRGTVVSEVLRLSHPNIVDQQVSPKSRD